MLYIFYFYFLYQYSIYKDIPFLSNAERYAILSVDGLPRFGW